MSNIKFRVLIEQDEDGIFVAEVPALPGCISQGSTRKEALENAQEAMELFIESLEAHGTRFLPRLRKKSSRLKFEPAPGCVRSRCCQRIRKDRL